MQGICDNPQPTHSDMALIPAQGRDQAAVDQDVAMARASRRMQPMGGQSMDCPSEEMGS